MVDNAKPDPKSVKARLLRLADADMVFWLMPPLIILLIVGTVAQRWIGLYEATNTFFSSFVIWAGPLPLPGGFTLLGILAANLTLKFLFKSEWSLAKSGIILSHLGALILLLGGLLTAVYAEEKYMIIPEGGETPFIYDYTKRSLMIFEDEKPIARMPFSAIDQWHANDFPFDIKIKKHCENCEILKREETKDYDSAKSYQSMAQFMALKPKAPEKEPEANLTGFEFDLSNTEADGHYLAFDGMPKPIEFVSDNKKYAFIFGKEQETLPFSIKLKDFVKETYPGTQKAKSYHSDVIIKDGDIEWETRIEMNEPLRYKGYTFFQSSFDQSDIGETTILSVVKNEGWLFPYIGTAVLGFGLLLHVIIIYRRKRT